MHCVSEADLRAYLLGDLPGPVAAQIAEHLDACPACETIAGRLDDQTDPIIRSLRRAFGEHLTLSVAGGDTPADTITADRPLGPDNAPAGYEILGELGRGGMSVVYQARQQHPRRVVALKMILAAAHAGAARKARFLAEGDATARLQHPNIVSVHEVGDHDGLPYVSLEYVPGGSLANRLGGVPQPPAEAAALVETLSRAVQYAHEQGVVHRDLKPGNVLLLGSHGQSLTEMTPKIVDFGLAKQAESALTVTGDILGTPQYMAPEQASGSKAVGPPADIYALGAILYECLTGRPPFRGESPLDTLEQVRACDPVPPRALQPGVSRELETVCLKCLARDPARRYESAAAVAEDLRRVRAGEPILARPAGAWERGRKWVRRRPAAATTAALIVILAVTASIATWLFKGQRDEARAARQDAVEKLRDSLIARARAGRTSGRPGRRFDSLDALTEAARLRPGDDLRDEVTACLTATDMRLARRWSQRPEGERWIDFDDTFTRYVAAGDDGRVSIRRVADDREELRIPCPIGETWPVLSRDGQYLWLHVEPNRRRQLWRLTGSTPTLVIDGGPNELGIQAVFRPTGGRIAISGPDGIINLYDLPAGTLAGVLPSIGEITATAYDPLGRRLAVATKTGLTIRDAETGATLMELPQSYRTADFIAWHPGGNLLAAPAVNLVISLWDVGMPDQARREAKFVCSVEGRRNRGINLEFNHAGDLLASTDWSARLRVCETATGRQLFSMPFVWTTLHFSADDRFLAGDRRDGQVALWEIDRGLEYRTLVWTEGTNRAFNFGQPTVSPDGRWVAVATNVGIGLWELSSGRQRAVIPCGRGTSAGFERSGAVISAGPDGPRRWPVSIAADGSPVVGPPEPLPLPGVYRTVAGTADGRIFAGVSGEKGYVVHRDRSDRPIPLQPLLDVRHVSLSPDGRWVVTGDHFGDGLIVWNADAGQLVRRLCPGHLSRSSYSPDGRLLAGGFTKSEGQMYEGRVWDTATWQERARFVGSPLAFGPDSRMLAVESGQGEVLLLAAETASIIARLEDPNLNRADFGCFTPDGASLVLSTNDDPAVHIWDLRLIRARLSERSLDWNLAPFPPRRSQAEPTQVGAVGDPPGG
jgi:WD40 repeat protein/tRNA A-37 threonylcarbamoyl transferase component Bud32